ncbi:hypothetical protein CNMCM6936_007976 [Aspergillus lentulus]|nr:hypothetical protein CNMCM6936_007976 [Aspergillus lentulus]
MRFLCHLSFSLALNKYYRVADEEADTMAAAITKRDNRSDQGFPDFYWRTTTEVRNMMPLAVLRTPPERSSLDYGERPVNSHSSAHRWAPPSPEGSPWEKWAILTYNESTTLTTPVEGFSVPILYRQCCKLLG